MILDAQNQLSAAQAVTSSAVSTNTIDLSQARDIGEGENLKVHINVDTSATAAGAATVTFEVITSANANLSSATVIAASAAIPKATLVAGYRLAIEIPRQMGSLGQRYFGVNYNVATGPLTAGAFTAYVAKDVDDRKFYPVGSLIS